MKKCIIFFGFVLFALSSSFAINVDEREVQSGGGDDSVDFINYTGRHDEIDTVEAIRGIGRGLSPAVARGELGSRDRYRLIHAVDSSVTTGLDADILILGSAVRVDHIDNLRLIIEGYLSSAYNYSQKDAKTLAHFITIYNAVYRGRIGVFNEKYKSVVLQHLSPSDVGLATTYSEWPGRTQIVIPLSDQRYSGTVSTVDTGTISDKEVVEKMKEQDDKDIDARKDMVDLKEKEAEEARKRAEEARKAALEKEKEASTAKKDEDAKRKDLKEKEDVAKKAQKDADDAKKAGSADQDAKQKLADKEREEAERARKEAEEAEKERKRREEEANKLKQDAKEEDEMAKKKEEDAQSDRKDIAKDTQKIIEDKKAEKKAETDALIASATRGYALKVEDEDSLSSSIVMLDLRTAKTIKTSSLKTIRGRRIYKAGDNILAIAGSSGGDSVVSLVLISMRNLEVAKQGDDVISERSVLVQNGEYYYAVLASGGKYYIGRFNEELERQALSSVSVSQYTPIIVTEQGLLVQDEANNIHLLDSNELKAITAKKSYTSFKNEEK